MKKVLILEDEVSIRSFVVINLKRAGYEVIEAGTGMEALEQLKKHPDVGVAILDIMLPDIDGFEVCRNIRATDKQIGVIMLTARSQEMDKVTGLMTGADDYVTKPFKLLELLSRIRAILRRSNNTILNSSDITIDISNMTVKCKGQTVFVTPIEFQLLSTLVRNNGVIVTRSVLLENIWDSDGSFIDDNTLSVHISRLREKIGAEHIKTVRGIGYRWEN